MIFWIIQIKAYYFKIYSSFRRRKQETFSYVPFSGAEKELQRTPFTDQPTFLARKASNLFPNPFPIIGTGLNCKIGKTTILQIYTKVKSTIKGRFWLKKIMARPFRGTGFASHTKTLKMRVSRNFQLSPFPTIGKGFGKRFEALLAKRVG